MTSISNTRDGRAARTALVQVLVLVAIVFWVFLPQFANMASLALSKFDDAHALAASVLILLVFLQRRRLLAESVAGPTWSGLVLVVIGLLNLAVAIWPFNYGYARWLALIPVIAGVIVVAAGWRALWRSLPIVALLLVAIPLPDRIYAYLIIRAETLTMETVAMLLDFLPGVVIGLDGQDFSYTRNGVSGTFALGEPHRGATIFLAYLTIGLFVTFMRVRPLWQLIALAVASAPILIICNTARLAMWGAFAILNGSHPLSQWPRLVATITALILAYLLFGLFAAVLGRVVAEGAGVEKAPVNAEAVLAMSSSGRRPGSRQASRSTFFSPPFVVAGVMLLAAAMGMGPALSACEHYFSKEPIALNKSLDDFDASRLEKFQPATGPITLGLSPGDLETEDFMAPVFEPVTGGAEAKKRNQTMLFVSYYSDPRERISHTPEVCYRQSGAVVESITTIPVDIPALGMTVDARLLDITQSGDHKALLYVLVCNGKVYHDRETVRFVIGLPGDKFTYFSKIETTKRVYPDQSFEETVELLKGLMREALPILIEDHYPTREQVRR